MANCIANEIQYDLTKKILVALNGEIVARSHKREKHSGLLCDGLDKLHAALDASSQVNRGKMRIASAVNAQHIVDGSRQQANPGAKMRNPLVCVRWIVGD